MRFSKLAQLALCVALIVVLLFEMDMQSKFTNIYSYSAFFGPCGTPRVIAGREEIGNSNIINSSTNNNSDGSKEYVRKCSPENFLVLVNGGAKKKYQRRRMAWRNSACPKTYQKVNITYHFMLALPAHQPIDPNGHNQGYRSSQDEIIDMGTIWNESLVHHDIIFLAMNDVYHDMNLKAIRMMEWAVDRGMTKDTSLVVIHDDEYCLHPHVLQAICENVALSNTSLYAGNHLWEQPGYDIQKGLDGSFAPYFSGWLYALSADLVRDIVFDTATMFTSMNLVHSEVQVGKWVKNQADRNKTIAYVVQPQLIWEVSEQES